MAAMNAEQCDLVSVVIPCYNQAHFLSEAIESVLGQAGAEFEVIVVDDGSQDATAEVAARYPQVRCIRQPNRGIAGARNAGFAASWGEFLLFLDADDRLMPGALASGVACLRACPGCAFAYGHIRLIAADGGPLTTQRQVAVNKDHYLELLRGCYIWTPGTVVCRRAALTEAGGFRGVVDGCEDYDLYLRLARRFPLCCNDRVVLEYRQHETKMSLNYARMLHSSVAALRAQREHAASDEGYQQALREGINEMRRGYGEPLVKQVRGQLRAGQWARAARGLAALLRAYPRGAVKACLPERVAARLRHLRRADVESNSVIER